jgi:4a-hydroxytetrahydrobiopterin dehydratase
MSTPDSLAGLAAHACQPLRGDKHRLPLEQIEAALGVLPGWKLIDDGEVLAKSFEFNDYYQTLAFVNALAYIAHAEDHHPDLSVHYNRCIVCFSTHDVGGVSQNDLICAAKAEQLYGTP